MHFINEKCVSSIQFHWSSYLRVHLTACQHWFRLWLGVEEATSHYLNQCWPSLPTQICGTRRRWDKLTCYWRWQIYTRLHNIWYLTNSLDLNRTTYKKNNIGSTEYKEINIEKQHFRRKIERYEHYFLVMFFPIWISRPIFWCFLWFSPEQTVEQTIDLLMIWDAIMLIMSSL